MFSSRPLKSSKLKNSIGIESEDEWPEVPFQWTCDSNEGNKFVFQPFFVKTFIQTRAQKKSKKYKNIEIPVARRQTYIQCLLPTISLLLYYFRWHQIQSVSMSIVGRIISLFETIWDFLRGKNFFWGKKTKKKVIVLNMKISFTIFWSRKQEKWSDQVLSIK